MSFVTRLTFQSGDRRALEGTLADIKEAAARKGVEFKGPHARPPEDYRVPLHASTEGDGSFGTWSYTVYEREIDVVGHDEFAREVAQWDMPPGIHVSAEVEQVSGMG